MSDQKVSLNRLDAVTKSLLILLNDKGIRYSSTSLSYGNYSVSGIHLLVVIWHFSKDSPSSLRHGLASCVHVLRSWTLYTKSKTSQYLRGKKPPHTDRRVPKCLATTTRSDFQVLHDNDSLFIVSLDNVQINIVYLVCICNLVTTMDHSVHGIFVDNCQILNHSSSFHWSLWSPQLSSPFCRSQYLDIVSIY